MMRALRCLLVGLFGALLGTLLAYGPIMAQRAVPLLGAGGGIAVTKGQGAYNFTIGGSASSMTAGFLSTVGAGHHICGFFAGLNASAPFTVTSVVDDKGNPYTVVDSTFVFANSFNLVGTSFYLLNLPANNPIQITVNTSAAFTFPVLIIDEFVGTLTSLDVHAINGQVSPGTGADAVTSGAVTSTSHGLVCGGMGNRGDSGNTSPGTGYTSGTVCDPTTTCTGADYAYSEYILDRAAGSVAATFTMPINDNTVTSIMTFK